MKQTWSVFYSFAQLCFVGHTRGEKRHCEKLNYLLQFCFAIYYITIERKRWLKVKRFPTLIQSLSQQLWCTVLQPCWWCPLSLPHTEFTQFMQRFICKNYAEPLIINMIPNVIKAERCRPFRDPITQILAVTSGCWVTVAFLWSPTSWLI